MDTEKEKIQGQSEKQASLSLRLAAVCQAVEELVTFKSQDEGDIYGTKDTPRGTRKSSLTLCDVGCDHALVPITLLEKGVVHKAIGMDVNAGPLERAKENMREHGISESALSLRLSNGLAALQPGEAQIVVIAGMGGLLVKEILEAADVRALGVSVLVLSPHTKSRELREYLRVNGFRICAEKEICDDGKYYPIISARVQLRQDAGQDKDTMIDTDAITEANAEVSSDSQAGMEHGLAQIISQVQEDTDCNRETAIRLCDSFGPLLLTGRDEVLHAYLLKRAKELQGVIVQIESGSGRSETQATAKETSIAKEMSIAKETSIAKKTAIEEVKFTLGDVRTALLLWE